MYFLFLPSTSYFSFCRQGIAETHIQYLLYFLCPPTLPFFFLHFACRNTFNSLFSLKLTCSLTSRKKNRKPTRLVAQNFKQAAHFAGLKRAQVASQMLSCPPLCHTIVAGSGDATTSTVRMEKNRAESASTFFLLIQHNTPHMGLR